jgi:capsular polysaccharide biosynthesis protein/Flp pilus assembly protein TadD
MADVTLAGALFAEAQARLRAGEAEAAEALLARGREADPGSAAMAFLHGVALLMSGRHRDAAGALAAALAIEPGNARAGLLLTRALRAAGDRAGTEAARARLLEAAGGDPDLLAEVAADLLEEEEPDAAARLLERALEIAPGHAGALHNLGVALARAGLIEAAEERLSAALDRAPGSHATAAALAGVALARGDADRALGLARGLVAAGANLAEARGVEGRALAAKGDAAGALAAFEEAARLAPGDAAAALNLARALEAGGRVGEAMGHWRRAAALGAPKDALARVAADLDPAVRLRLYGRAPAEGERIVRAAALGDLPGAGVATAGPIGLEVREMEGVALYGDLWLAVAGERAAEAASLDLVYAVRGDDRRFYRAHGVDGAVLLGEAEVFEDPEPTLFLGGSTNYYHWTVDFLPRLAALEALPGSGDRRVLVNGRLAPYQLRMMEVAGLDPDRLKTPQPDALTRYARLWVPTLPGRPRRPDGTPDWMRAHHDARQLGWLRERLGAAARPRAGGPRRVMVLREGATLRRCENEAAVLDLARARGFEPVRLETLSFDDQAALFAGAEAVLAVHGAGCTNMVFAPAGAALVELHPAGHLPPFYVEMCRQLGQRHVSVPGRATRSLAPLLPAFWDFRVDLDQVAAALDGI